MTAPGKRRILWLDGLRIVAAFLVIVNHTNSDVFQASQPGQLTWHLSILWYYLSKIAVPLFVMISGAVLLERQDSYRKVLARAGRVLLVLLLASYAYFVYDAWAHWGLWPRIARLDILLGQVWRQEITDGFWYLYFYLGLMLTLPLWQRMSLAMKARDYGYGMALCFGLGAGWPLLSHYVPALALPRYLDACVPISYVGLFFAGAYVRKHLPIRRSTPWIAGVTLVLCLIASWLMTWLEFTRVEPGAKYWFMDDRLRPGLPIIGAAVAAMVLARCLGERCPEPSRRTQALLSELGACSFGIYLGQDLLIAETENRLFLPLQSVLPSMAAVLIWEVAVFALALLLVWLLRRIPPIRRIL